MNQLKRLLLSCLLDHPRTLCSTLPDAAILHLVGAVLTNRDDPDWRFYFALSIRIYQDLYVCFPIYKHIVQGFLAMAMENDAITVSEARNIIEQFEEKGKHHKTSERVVGSFTIDFDLALTKPDDAKAHTLALKFHELSIFDQFTSGEFVNQEVEATREMEEKITTVS